MVLYSLFLQLVLLTLLSALANIHKPPDFVIGRSEYLAGGMGRVLDAVRGTLNGSRATSDLGDFRSKALLTRPAPTDLKDPGNRKIAFLFMSRNHMPLEDVWREFFHWKANASHYSIYTHTHINFRFPKTSFFYGTQLPQMEEIKWGNMGQVRGIKRLVRAAMEDLYNSWFVMMSESCIPLHPFSVFRANLLDFNQSIVNACDFGQAMEADGRWKPGLDDVGLKKTNWRKSATWFALHRKHAAIFANELHMEPGWEKVPCCDEHYLPTTLSHYGLDNETTCSDGFAHVHWNSLSDSHPVTYSGEQIGPDLFRHLNEPVNAAERGFGMQCSGVPGVCHFTARKFSGSYKYQLLENLDLILSDDHGGQYTGNPWDHHQDKLREENDTYYLIENGQLRLLPDLDTIKHMHLDASKAKPLDQIDLTAYPKGPVFPSRKDGQLIRYAKSNWIFLIKDGKRHGIPNLDTFFSLNATMAQVKVVSSQDLESIVMGDPIPDTKLHSH